LQRSWVYIGSWRNCNTINQFPLALSQKRASGGSSARKTGEVYPASAHISPPRLSAASFRAAAPPRDRWDVSKTRELSRGERKPGPRGGKIFPPFPRKINPPAAVRFFFRGVRRPLGKNPLSRGPEALFRKKCPALAVKTHKTLGIYMPLWIKIMASDLQCNLARTIGSRKNVHARILQCP
jgi:hypothetical protein